MTPKTGEIDNMKLFVVTSPLNFDKIQVEKVSTIYCPNDAVYYYPENGLDFIQHARMVYQAEKEKADWIRAYENAMQGLKYWKSIAEEK